MILTAEAVMFEEIDPTVIEKFLHELPENAFHLGVRVLLALVFFFIGVQCIKLLRKLIKKSLERANADVGVTQFIDSFIKVGTYAILIMLIATSFGVDAASIIAVFGSAGVAIGLALQGSLSNLAGGVLILILKPFKVGDYIEAAGESGVVSEISVVYTELLTLDNKRITIPNGTLTNSVIENYSSEELRRVDLTFNTAYDCDIETVKKVISKVIEENPMALKNPAPFVRLSEHGENALTYTVRIWCKNADYWDVNFDTIESVKKAFDENGIKIPYYSWSMFRAKAGRQ